MMTDEHAVGGCDKVLLVQAEFDGELDAAEAAQLAVHRAGCPVCRAAEAELAQARELLQGDLYQPMPDDVRALLLARLGLAAPQPASAPARRFRIVGDFAAWRPSTLGFGLGAACAAALMLFVLSPDEQSLTDQVVSGHVRALQPGHLEDVLSEDRHTVKPWFDGRIDFAPPVKDLVAQQFPLKGGRLDYIGGRPVAALVYQRDKHVIDLFVRPAAAGTVVAPETAEKNGYNVVHWVQDGMAFWAVSDVERNQLRDFAAIWQRTP
jgi:anti-sigma factor RsiW